MTLLLLALINTFLSTTVIFASLVSIFEDLVCFCHLGKLLFGSIIARVFVGMVLEGQLTISLLDVSCFRIFLNCEDLVEISIL